MDRIWDKRLERYVAVQIIPPSILPAEAACKRFGGTLKALAQVRDQHVAMVYDLHYKGTNGYLISEYVEGVGLDEVLSKGPVAQPKLLDWGMQLAEGLEAVHKQNIIHRDLKPSNVRLTPSGQLKIIGFGLATRLDPIADTVQTVTSGLLTPFQGTLPYMAPERWSGGIADARSDLWAAGTVLYEMATGRRAFLGSELAALRDTILNEDPPTASTVNPGISPSLDKVIFRALVKDPDKRYQTANELYMDLQSVQSGSTLSS